MTGEEQEVAAKDRLDDDRLLADPEPLAAWFDAHFGGARAPLTLERISGGQSNSLFRARRAGQSFAIRRPPASANDRTSHNLAREIRLMTALAQSSVPHARMIGGTIDPAWIGGPFIVLEWVDGFTPRDPMPAPFSSDLILRGDLGGAVIDALADIAKVDWQGLGLTDFGKPEGFLDRQVDRWLAQYERCRTREILHFDAVVAWLRVNRPASFSPGLMHGDYSFANVMVRPQPPVRLVVVDWELTTIGDPLLDLGHLLSSWGDATTGPTWAPYIDWHRGFSTRRDAAARYAERSGRDVGAIGFYMVLAMLRLAVILEGSYARWLAGKSDKPRHAAFEQRVPDIIAQAARTIDQP